MLEQCRIEVVANYSFLLTFSAGAFRRTRAPFLVHAFMQLRNEKKTKLFKLNLTTYISCNISILVI